MPHHTTPPNQQAFHESIWTLLTEIPTGKVITYGRLAHLAGPPANMDLRTFNAFAARWAGGALAHCPEGLPWWRVINAQGRISPRESAGRQRELLESEGVEFDTRGRIDLDRYLWNP